MVHQHFMLARKFDVIESITSGLPEPRFLLNRGKMEKQIRAFGKKHQLEIDPSAKIWQLSVGEQQRVEIIRLLYRGAEILILDEPTSALDSGTEDRILGALGRLKQSRTTFIITRASQQIKSGSIRSNGPFISSDWAYRIARSSPGSSVE